MLIPVLVHVESIGAIAACTWSRWSWTCGLPLGPVSLHAGQRWLGRLIGAKPSRRDTGALVADEGEAARLPLMALGPAVTTPRHGQTVAR
jgi:hypothetical protein